MGNEDQSYECHPKFRIVNNTQLARTTLSNFVYKIQTKETGCYYYHIVSKPPVRHFRVEQFMFIKRTFLFHRRLCSEGFNFWKRCCWFWGSKPLAPPVVVQRHLFQLDKVHPLPVVGEHQRILLLIQRVAGGDWWQWSNLFLWTQAAFKLLDVGRIVTGPVYRFDPFKWFFAAC